MQQSKSAKIHKIQNPEPLNVLKLQSFRHPFSPALISRKMVLMRHICLIFQVKQSLGVWRGRRKKRPKKRKRPKRRKRPKNQRNRKRAQDQALIQVLIQALIRAPQVLIQNNFVNYSELTQYLEISINCQVKNLLRLIVSLRN